MDFKMIVGLGNPGASYATTYHNCGQLCLDFLLRDHAANWKHEHSYSLIQEKNILYVKPTTFMNESGRAVRHAADYYKVPPARIIVLHDDADMELGVWRLRHGGGSGGHRGIESVMHSLDSDTFWRLKFGIRHPSVAPEHATPVHEPALDLVLRPIPPHDMKILQRAFAEGEKSLLNVIENEMP
jgi:PTH1 family peptidyl-tRNA hydrolase